MKIFKYNIQYNIYKKGILTTVKESLISNDDKVTFLTEMVLIGLKNVKIIRTKTLN